MRRFLATGLALALAAAPFAMGVAQAEDTLNPPHWQSQGTFGSYDKAALQRGFLVYQTVCASCHSMNALHYRDLEAIGLTTEQIAAIASNVKTGNGTATANDVFAHPHLPAGSFGGAHPPDLSNIIVSNPGGLHYVYNVLTGYADTPADVTLAPNEFYNTAAPGNQLAMPAPLKDNQVAYADGVKPTAQQEAMDVTAFLAWASDPNLDARHEIGLRAILFLIFLAILAIVTKRKIWRETV